MSMKNSHYSNGSTKFGALEVDQDEDLKDLIDKRGSKAIGGNGAGHYHSIPNPLSILIGNLRYMLHSCCYFYPVTCGIISILSIATVMWLFLGYVINPTEYFGQLEHDHSDIASKFDLKMSDVKHWCLGQNDNSCTCDDPLVPLARTDHASWIVAVKNNRLRIDSFTSSNTNPDVAFLGESIVEEMDGRWLGRPDRNLGLTKLHKMFEKNFKQPKTSLNDHEHKSGVALGIAGDTCANVLWRLTHGEMPETFNPKVWWLSLGMNDLARTRCSEEVVLIGILRIVEEILSTKPGAHLVINSLLPMTKVRGDKYPVISDVEDSFVDNADKEQPKEQPNPKSRARLLQKGGKDLELQAEQEEAQRNKKVERKNNKKFKKEAETQKAEVLVDRSKIKKFKPGHIRENKIPLWASVKAINQALEKFAKKHSDRVHYFDAVPFFTQPKEKGKLTIRSDRLTPRGHPTLEGFRVLEEEMIKFLDPILINLYAQIAEKNDDEINPHKTDYNTDSENTGQDLYDLNDDTIGMGSYLDDYLFGGLDSHGEDDEYMVWGEQSEFEDDFGTFSMEDDFAY